MKQIRSFAAILIILAACFSPASYFCGRLSLVPAAAAQWDYGTPATDSEGYGIAGKILIGVIIFMAVALVLITGPLEFLDMFSGRNRYGLRKDDKDTEVKRLGTDYLEKVMEQTERNRRQAMKDEARKPPSPPGAEEEHRE